MNNPDLMDKLTQKVVQSRDLLSSATWEPEEHVTHDLITEYDVPPVNNVSCLWLHCASREDYVSLETGNSHIQVTFPLEVFRRIIRGKGSPVDSCSWLGLLQLLRS